MPLAGPCTEGLLEMLQPLRCAVPTDPAPLGMLPEGRESLDGEFGQPEQASLVGFPPGEWTPKPKSSTGWSCKLELPVLSTLGGLWSSSPWPGCHPRPGKDTRAVRTRTWGRFVWLLKGDFQTNPIQITSSGGTEQLWKALRWKAEPSAVWETENSFGSPAAFRAANLRGSVHSRVRVQGVSALPLPVLSEGV